MNFLQQHAAKGEVVTGLLYVDREPEDLHQHFNTVDDAAQRAGREGAVPGLGGAGEDQRQPALNAFPRSRRTGMPAMSVRAYDADAGAALKGIDRRPPPVRRAPDPRPDARN